MLKVLVRLTLIFSVLTFGLTVLDFLALHDIRHEYVSQNILRHLGVTLSKELPAWTSTGGEWGIVGASLLSRGVFLILNTVVLAICIRRLRGLNPS